MKSAEAGRCATQPTELGSFAGTRRTTRRIERRRTTARRQQRAESEAAKLEEEQRPQRQPRALELSLALEAPQTGRGRAELFLAPPELSSADCETIQSASARRETSVSIREDGLQLDAAGSRSSPESTHEATFFFDPTDVVVAVSRSRAAGGGAAEETASVEACVTQDADGRLTNTALAIHGDTGDGLAAASTLDTAHEAGRVVDVQWTVEAAHEGDRAERSATLTVFAERAEQHEAWATTVDVELVDLREDARGLWRRELGVAAGAARELRVSVERELDDGRMLGVSAACVQDPDETSQEADLTLAPDEHRELSVGFRRTVGEPVELHASWADEHPALRHRVEARRTLYGEESGLSVQRERGNVDGSVEKLAVYAARRAEGCRYGWRLATKGPQRGVAVERSVELRHGAGGLRVATWQETTGCGRVARIGAALSARGGLDLTVRAHPAEPGNQTYRADGAIRYRPNAGVQWHLNLGYQDSASRALALPPGVGLRQQGDGNAEILLDASVLLRWAAMRGALWALQTSVGRGVAGVLGGKDPALGAIMGCVGMALPLYRLAVAPSDEGSREGRD